MVAVTFVQHFDLINNTEERTVAQSWPKDTVRSTEALHGDDINNITHLPGVKAPFVLRLLQGPTPDGSAFITAAFVDCQALLEYVNRAEFPSCDQGLALDIAPRDGLTPVSARTVAQVASGAVAFEAAVLSHGVAVTMPVRLHARDLRRSETLSRMFSDIGVTILIGERDTPPAALAKALTPEMYFRSPNGAEAIDRVRTYFANKYGNGAVVQTFSQRLAAQRTDAVIYSRALWVAIGFAIVLTTATFGIAAMEDTRRRRAVSSALVAAGIPEPALHRAAITAAGLTLLPGIALSTVTGAYAGHILTITARAHVGTPYTSLLLLTALTTGASFLIVTVLIATSNGARQLRPSAIAPE